MRPFLLSLLALFVLGLWAARGQSLLQPSDSIVIAGDSITEQRIYTVFMEDYFLMCQPVPLKRVAQLGWSGEWARGLLARLDSDLYPFHPTVVTTCYGMNDGRYVGPDIPLADDYRKNQTAIVENLKKHGVRVIVLGSSKCVDTNFYHSGDAVQTALYNKTLSNFNDIDRDIAQKEGIVYADVFDATKTAMDKSKAVYGPTYVFGGDDGVHPHADGQLVMAYAFLKALGCDAIGTLTVDMGFHRAQGSPGQKIVSFQDGTLEVESSRYPFCFQGNPTKPDENMDASIIRFVPFNEDLNRYMLVVTGLSSAKAKVTWGTESKEFSAADLRKGINLAAEFLDNPFVGQFKKVNDAVQAQQDFETPLVKEFLHNIGEFKSMVPQDSATLDKVGADGVNHSYALFQAAAALVTPVDHKLTIEPLP